MIIENGTLVSPGLEVAHGWLEISGRKISAVSDGRAKAPKGKERLDAQGGYIVPGFIDIHTHGAGGASAMDGYEALRKMAEVKLREGVTTFLPTTWTAPKEDLVRAMSGVAEYQANPEFAKTPAVHIEGPFLNPDCLGAQNPLHVRKPDIREIDRLARIAPVALVSFAPEMSNGLKFAAQLKERGIVGSMAHTNATYAQFKEAKAAGMTHLTHYCNQMTKLHHREIGLVGAALLDDSILAEMICDTIHLCPDMIALAFKHIPVERIMIITDSISASWLPDGNYLEGGQAVIVKDGVCRLKAGNNLAGSTSRFYEGLRNVMEITGIPLKKLIRATSLNQAKSLGIKKVGRLREGWFADVVVLDRDTFQPRVAVVEGKLATFS